MALQVFCNSCRWWERAIEGEPKGWCKRFPPQVYVKGNIPKSVWPKSVETDWCSEGYDAPE